MAGGRRPGGGGRRRRRFHCRLSRRALRGSVSSLVGRKARPRTPGPAPCPDPVPGSAPKSAPGPGEGPAPGPRRSEPHPEHSALSRPSGRRVRRRRSGSRMQSRHRIRPSRRGPCEPWGRPEEPRAGTVRPTGSTLATHGFKFVHAATRVPRSLSESGIEQRSPGQGRRVGARARLGDSPKAARALRLPPRRSGAAAPIRLRSVGLGPG
jgi:hypothetical protein